MGRIKLFIFPVKIFSLRTYVHWLRPRQPGQDKLKTFLFSISTSKAKLKGMCHADAINKCLPDLEIEVKKRSFSKQVALAVRDKVV